MITRGWYAGFEAIVVSSSRLSLMVVPECGGKIVSLLSQGSGREWLWRDPARPLRRPSPGGQFARHDISGWDECFPTIGECRYPAGAAAAFAGVPLSDHGELWSRPWQAAIEDETLAMSCPGAALPYHFWRSVSALPDGTVQLDYRVENRSDMPMRYLWSAHPLLTATAGLRIVLPASAQMTKEFGYGGRIGADGDDGSRGRFSVHTWPTAQGADGVRRDLSRVEFQDPPVTDKVVLRGLTAGWAELADPAAGESLRLEFPLDDVPYLGICMNYAAWPFGDRPGRWLALEPTSGGTDRLDQAVARAEAAELPAGGLATWQLRLSVRARALPVIAAGLAKSVTGSRPGSRTS